MKKRIEWTHCAICRGKLMRKSRIEEGKIVVHADLCFDKMLERKVSFNNQKYSDKNLGEMR